MEFYLTKKFDPKKKEKLKAFERILNAQGPENEYSRFCIPPETSILTNRRESNINWPITIDPKEQASLDNTDFILATCPQQKADSYPGHLEIKAGALEHDRMYFFNNIRNGIATFQDRDVQDSIF